MQTKICNLFLIAAMLAAVLLSNLRLVQAGNLLAPVNATQGTVYWTDPQGDVTEPSADLISGSITITPDNAYVDVRAQFAGKPLTPVARIITWCLDLDQNPTTENVSCGWGRKADSAFSLSYNSFYDDYGFAYFDRSEGVMKGVNACQITWYDAASKTLRVKFPRSWLGDDGIFNYSVETIDEKAPNSASLGSPGRYFTSAKTDTELPFAGDWLCSEPALAASSTKLNFSMPAGGATPPSQVLDLTNMDHLHAPLAWKAVESLPWISLSKTSGVTPDSTLVSVNPSGLKPGIYSGSIELTGTSIEGNSGLTVFSTLEILPPAGSKPSFCPVSRAGKMGTNDWYQYFGENQFAPTDQMSVSFSVLPVAAGFTDITLDAEGGESLYGIHFEDGLVNGIYSYNPGQWNSVEALYNFSARQYTLTINGQTGNPIAFNYGTSASVQAFRMFTETGSAWLDSLSIKRITGSTQSPLFGADFDNGDYSDVAGTPPTAQIPYPCTDHPTTWKVSPLELNFEVEKGTGSPPVQQISIEKNGQAVVTWAASETILWLQTNPASGSAPGNMNVNINPAGLAAGTYNGEIILTPAGISGSPQTVRVNLKVTPPTAPTLVVSPKVLNFDAEKGLTDPEPQSIRIMSGNELALVWSLQEEIEWLSIDQVSGTSPAEAQVSIDTSGLEPGSYTGEIHIASSNAKDSPQMVAVSLYVAPQRPPLALTAVGGVNNIRLDWTPSSNPKVMRYRIYRAMEGSPTPQPVAEVQDTVYLDRSADLLADSRYCYSVEVLGPNDQWLGASTGACAVFGRLELKVGDAWAGSNQEAIIPLLIQNATGLKIAAGDFWLKLDCSLVEPLEVRTTPLTAGYTWNYNISQTGDSCLVKIAALSNPPVELFGQGALFWLKVKVRAVEAVDSPMELQPFTAGSGGTEIYRPDNLTTPLALQMQNGMLHLSQNYRLGDLNGNGVVQAVDAYIALQIASGIYTPLDWQRYCGDANSDGRISPADASMILYYAVTSNWPQPTQAASQPVLAKAADEPVKLSLSSGRATPGGTVQIILRAENLMNFAGTHLVVAYDPRFIASVSQVEAIGLGKNFSLDFNDDGLGMVKIAMADRSGISGSGDLLRLTLRVKANAPRETRTMLALAEVHLNDPFGRDFATSALQQSVLRTNGSVTLRDETIYLPVMGW